MSNNTEHYFNVPQPRLKILNPLSTGLSYHS